MLPVFTFFFSSYMLLVFIIFFHCGLFLLLRLIFSSFIFYYEVDVSTFFVVTVNI